MIKEIGSEFWEVELVEKASPILEKNYQFLLTGRTALDYLIKDIKSNRKIKSVYMPSYCCHTMIKPFLDNGIDVEFYNISFKDSKYTYEINFETNCDLVLIMQYFGFYNGDVGQAVERFKGLGKIVIEDATHSWFSSNPYSYKSDYVFASLRKWTGLACGAILIKRYDCFYNLPPNKINNRYKTLKDRASKLKKQYIEEGRGQKEVFLKMFTEATNLIKDDYQDYKISEQYEDTIKEIDIKRIMEGRRKNAEVIIKGLDNTKIIDYISITDKDTPLFVPIVVSSGRRDELRQYLIDNSIYCPVHWPLSEEHKVNNKTLYENSLSLICDQRYGESEMEYMLNKINGFI